ncbi:hypothetical protein ACJX0J_027338 [Zea mays]
MQFTIAKMIFNFPYREILSYGYTGYANIYNISFRNSISDRALTQSFSKKNMVNTLFYMDSAIKVQESYYLSTYYIISSSTTVVGTTDIGSFLLVLLLENIRHKEYIENIYNFQGGALEPHASNATLSLIVLAHTFYTILEKRIWRSLNIHDM